MQRRQLTVDYSLVVVEDVWEGEDEDEDEVDDAAPSMATCTSSLLPAQQVLGPKVVDTPINADSGVAMGALWM
jgi:hypothetical protein